MDSPLIKRQTSLSANIVAFCRFLRTKGFTIGPKEEADALRAMEALQPFQNPAHLQLCLRTALARTYGQLLLFDELYTQYWRELDKAVDSKIRHQADKNKPKSGKSANNPGLQSIKNWLQGNASTEETEMATYSTQEVLSRKDFSLLAEEELFEVARLIHRIARTLALRESRRRKPSQKRVQLDLRRTLRKNMRCGGELLDLVHFQPARRKTQIVLLCDVSKSMDLYSRFLLQFIYAFQSNYRRIEAFVFSTQLHRVTAAFRRRDFRAALDEATAQVNGWSGGTKIGASLSHFCKNYAGRLLNRRTVVIIISDGWDTGEVQLLEERMCEIQRKAAKVIWLNPLAGNTNYKAETKGMQAALPYVDVFAPGHNVESLRRLYHQL